MTAPHRSRSAAATLAFAALAAAPISAAPAAAQPSDDFPFDRFTLSVGSFFQTTDSALRVDIGTDATGTLISLEEDLGLDDSSDLLRLEGSWRFLDRHQLTAGYYELSRDGRRTIDRDIEVGDTVFPFQASVAAESDIQFADLYYTYWAVKRPKGGLGLGLGVSALGVDAALEATAESPVGGGTLRFEESASTDLPVPLLSLEGRWAPASRLLLSANFRFLPEVEVEDWKGDVFAYGLALEWRMFRHFGLGASWTSLTIDAEVEDDRLRGAIDLTIEGAQVYAKFAG